MTGTRLIVGAVVGAIIALLPTSIPAQVAFPRKDEWKMHDGSTVRGQPYAFGYQLCFLQRRGGKLLLNGQKIEDPSSHALLQKLCDEQRIPLDDTERLQKLLAKQRFAQIVLPYYTLRYTDPSGKDQMIPTILLAPEEIQELRPVFEMWLAEQHREHEERMRYAQQLRNQQAMLEMQADALRAQEAMARAAARSAEANERQADELERIRRQAR